MSEKPIIFSAEMVRAILDGRKTQTRRVMKPQPNIDEEQMWHWKDCQWMEGGIGFPISGVEDYAPYLPGNILWVRETFFQYGEWHTKMITYKNCEAAEKYAFIPCGINDPIYFADALPTEISLKRGYRSGRGYYKRTPTHMPRAAARLFLKVKAVRVERLNDISDADAIAEGFTGIKCDNSGHAGLHGCEDCLGSGWREPPQVDFMDYWDRLNAKKGFGWDVNPWVWVIEFERILQ